MTARKLLFYSLLSLFLSVPFSFSVRAERAYTIYESELTALEENLTTLKKHNKEKQELLSKQAKQLEEAQKQLAIVNEQLKKSKEWNEMTLNSLENANQSLAQYEKEAEHKIKVKARQRNLWILISAGLGYLAIR
nr:MAG TPA: hypothetical protein [Caudoviricetes sp.]